jgi:ABC-type phosphonate transport system ATPase subunit
MKGNEKKRRNVKRKEIGMIHLGKKSAQRTSSSAGTLGGRDVLSFGREKRTAIRVFWTKTSHS